MAAAHVGEDHYDEVRRKPDIVVTHVLVDVDEYQDARHEYTKDQVSPLRNTIRGKKLGEKKQIYEHYQPRKEEGKQQEVKVHLTHSFPLLDGYVNEIQHASNVG